MMTWSQAQQACLLAGKRLCTVSEWHAAAAGTVHPGEHQGSQGGECHTQVVEPRPTGRAGARPADASSCISSWGAEDMVGNVWEWVDAAGGPAPSSGMQSVGSSVLPVVAAREGGTTWIGRLPVTLLRSGYWSYGANAGAVSPAGIASEPYADADIGVRCCVGGG